MTTKPSTGRLIIIMQKIILASASNERKRLLDQIRLPFEVVVSNYPEKLNQHLDPKQTVKQLAYGKAETVADQWPDALVIGADTVIFCDNRVVGKPKDHLDAQEILSFLRGKRHTVYTGLALVCKALGKKIIQVVKTAIWMRQYTDQEIEAYIATGEPLGKAGAYAILENGNKLIEKIDGDIYNVAGLPVGVLIKTLSTFGITLGENWHNHFTIGFKESRFLVK